MDSQGLNDMQWVDMNQRDRLVRCLRDTLEALRERAPKADMRRENHEMFLTRLTAWYDSKAQFYAYCVKCLRHVSPNEADFFAEAFDKVRR
jgi:hypothetical protein